MASLHPNIHLFIPSVISVSPWAVHMSEETFCLFSSQERWVCFHLSAQIPKGDRQKGGVGRDNILTVCNNKKNDRSHRQRSKELPASHAQSQMKGNGWQIRQQQAACRTDSALPRSTGTTKYWRISMQLLHQLQGFPEFLASTDKDIWPFPHVTVKGNNLALNYLCCDHIWTSWHSGESNPLASIAKWVIN